MKGEPMADEGNKKPDVTVGPDVKVTDAVKPNNGFYKPEKKSIIPRVLPSPVKAYTANVGRGRVSSLTWEQPEWDLAECGRILDTESIVRRAFRAKKNLFLKEGYEIVGPNIDRVRYIKKRIQQIESASGVPFEILMSQTISSLVRCSNAFWVKVRKEQSSGGRRRKINDNQRLEPVAGYFILPAETVRMKRDEYGRVKKYQQEIDGKVRKEFKPEDIIHFYFDKREGFAIGTPILTPVKDDIRALRRIEENVELLVYQHLFPLFHYQVGTPDAPAAVFPDGKSEIDVVRAEVAAMPSDGCWVTPERHTISAVQTSQGPVAVEKVIDHFKTRIYIGLGVSSVDMGEGGSANRSTAQTMSKNLIDDTKSDQREFSTQFYAEVIRELLLESTFPPSTLWEEENRVSLQFKEIDIEARQAIENHYADLYDKNLITHDEARLGMGREVFQGSGWPTSKGNGGSGGSQDFSRTHYGLIGRDTIVLQSLDEPGTPASKSEVKSRTQQNKNNSVSNKNKPQNQHGTRSSAKINKDAFRPILGAPSMSVIVAQRAPLGSMYKDIKNDIINRVKFSGVSMRIIKSDLTTAFAEAHGKLGVLAKQSYRIGLRDTNHMPWEVNLTKTDERIENHIEKYITKLRDQMIQRIDASTIKSQHLKHENAVLIELIFDAMEHRTAMIDNSEIMRAYNYGRLSGYLLDGKMDLNSVPHSSNPCEKCNAQFLITLNADDIIYEELPPWHPGCQCKLEAK
jgi:hypothetical protein